MNRLHTLGFVALALLIGAHNPLAAHASVSTKKPVEVSASAQQSDKTSSTAAKDAQTLSPLETAVKQGAKLIELLSQHAPYATVAQFVNDYFAQVTDPQLRSAFINADDFGSRPLIVAVRCGVKMIKLLLEHGATVNQRGWIGTTALITAVQGAARNPGSVESIQLLLAAGADVNAADLSGATALIEAAYALYAHNPEPRKIVTLLLAARADVNAVDKGGRTPLIGAAGYGYRPETLEIVKALLAAGAQVNTANKSYTTALGAAASSRSEETVKLLIAHGADVNACTKDSGYTVLMSNSDKIQKILLEHGANVYARTKEFGHTALIRAVLNKSVKSVQLLLEYGSDVNARSNDGRNCLDSVKEDLWDNTSREIFKLLLKHKIEISPSQWESINMSVQYHLADIELVKLLLAYTNGFDKDMMLRHAVYRMLHNTIREPYIKAAQLLLKHGANPHSEKYDSHAMHYDKTKTAYMLAQESTNAEIKNLFSAKKAATVA